MVRDARDAPSSVLARSKRTAEFRRLGAGITRILFVGAGSAKNSEEEHDGFHSCSRRENALGKVVFVKYHLAMQRCALLSCVCLIGQVSVAGVLEFIQVRLQVSSNEFVLRR